MNNKKLPQEELLKIVWKDLYRLLDDMKRTFNLIFELFITSTIIIVLLIISIIVSILAL